MNYSPPVYDVNRAHYSRWSYNTSYARSEPLSLPRPRSQIVPPSLPTPCPPPALRARPPIQISPGVWVENQGILYSSEYPPVQKYLEETREQRTFLRPPSEVILALAALDVAEHPEDPAHWIIWNMAHFNDMHERVDKVFLEQPRRIKTRVPWSGKSYRPTLVSRQLKYECVHIQRRWYATEVGEKSSAAGDSRRATRSSSTNEDTDITAAQYFHLVPNKLHLLKGHTSKAAAPARKRAKRTATKRKPPTRRVPKAAVEEDLPFEKRTSTRVRRKITASDRSPRILSSAGSSPSSNNVSDSAEASSSTSPAESSSSTSHAGSPSSTTPTHTRNRSSSSQASNETLVESTRSPSVAASVSTVIGASSPKKRKAIDLEDEDGAIGEESDPTPTTRMVTRGRPPKPLPIDSEKSSTPSRTSTPSIDSETKRSRPNTRIKKTRVS